MRYVDPGIVLVLVGGGFKDWQAPDSIVNVLNKVVVVPRVPYEELREYTASADIGVLFYRNDCRNNYYCAPNKVHEYMMMGLPVITCDYPGIKKIVEQENVGLCVNPEQPKAIAEAIHTLVRNQELYHRMKQNCLRVSRDIYNWENEAQKLYTEYVRILKPKDPAPNSARLRVADRGDGRTLRGELNF